MDKFVFISNIGDKVATEVAAYIKTLGYTPFTCGPETNAASPEAFAAFIKPYKDNFHGAIFTNPPIIRSEIETATDEMWVLAREGFVVSMLNMAQVICDIFADKNFGRIIYLNSIHAEKPLGEGFLYTMGCAAAQSLSRETALVYGDKNVASFCVMRGIVEGEEGYFASEYSSIYHNSQYRFPKERIPKADSLNEFCAFLLGDGSYILNGAEIRADEGFVMFQGKSKLH